MLLVASVVACASGRGAVGGRLEALDVAQASAARAVREFASAADARDVAALERALHPGFRVAFAVAGGDSVMTVDREGYLAGIRGGRLGGSPRSLEFDAVAVTGALARVHARLRGASGRFDSEFVLARSEGRWTVLQDTTLFAPAASP